VICNEREYRITKSELRKFEEAIDANPGYMPSKGTDPRMKDVMKDALESMAETLREEIQRYEDLRDGRVRQRKLDGLTDLPTALIEARIAAGLTQKGLAERLSLKEQQIQRWESDRYSGVGLRRIQEVVDALGMGITETVRYAAAA
jgi:ribosome-binding protein aMBF1 (putative translation factor)